MNKSTLAIVLLCWTGLALGNFPLPTVDDLFFIGAALNMAHGGGFVNLICPSQAIWGAGDYFFAYMPFHSYALLAWFKLVGVSRAALVTFQALAGAVASLALIDLLWSAGDAVRRGIVAAAITVAVIILGSGLGLRPDLLALALFATGARLIKVHGLPAYFGCSLLLFLSAITSPSFATPVLILLALHFWSERNQSRSILLKRAALVAVAGFTVFLVFLYLIDFQLHTFLTVFNRFRHHSTFTPPYPVFSANLWHTVESLVSTTAPAFFAVIIPLLALAFSSVFDRPNGRAIWIGFMATGAALIFASYQSGSGIAFLILFDLGVVLFIFSRVRTKRAVACVAPLLGLVFAIDLLVQGRRLILFLMMPFLPVHNQVQDYLAYIARQQPPAIYLDSAAAAELYGYRIPPNAYDAAYGYRDRWDSSPPAQDLPVGTVYVVASWMTGQLGLEATDSVSSKSGSIHRSSRLPVNPYQLVFVTVARDSSSQKVFQFLTF